MAERGSDYRCAECGLQALQARSQVDFEIDFFERILDRNPNFIEVLVQIGEIFIIKGWSRRAHQVYQRLVELIPNDPEITYKLACSHARLRQPQMAVVALRRAFASGYSPVRYLWDLPDWDPIRQSVEFREFLKEVQAG